MRKQIYFEKQGSPTLEYILYGCATVREFHTIPLFEF